MEIKLNKNFEQEYKDDAWRGFSTRELLFLLLAVIQAGTEMYLAYRYLDVELSLAVYIVVPSTVPVLSIGFFKYQGMTPLELLKEIYYEQKTKCLVYAVGEREKIAPFVYRTNGNVSQYLSRKEKRTLRKVWKKQRRKEHRNGNI